MSTTDVYGWIETLSGKTFFIFTNGTDHATTIFEVQAQDLAGNAQSIKDALRGETISRVKMSVCDGSILSSLMCKKGGAYMFYQYGGERLANGPQVYNVDIWDLSIPVDDTTYLYALTAD